ncbi:MAG: alkaline phosphatase family protein [Acidobacteriota bacterium]
MPNRSLLSTLRSGFLTGAATYGSAISLAHALHNRLDSARDTLVLWLWCGAAFGAWMAAMFALGFLPALVARRRALDPEHARHCDPRWWGLLGFNLIFWELFFLHGLTYDHYPFGTLHSVWGMLAFLAAYGLVIAAGVLLLTLLLFALVRGASRAVFTAVLIAFLAAHGVSVLRGVPEGKAKVVRPAAIPITPEATDLSVMMVDLDGADWRVMQPMIDKGELPNFAEIMRRGTSGPLPTIKDSNSAVIWASIFSGMRPEVHGVLDFYRIQLPGMAGAGVFPVHRTFFKEIAEALAPFGLAERTTMSRGELHALPLWEILDHYGISIGVVDGFYYSFPALPMSTPGGYFVSYGTDLFYSKLIHEPGSAKLSDSKLFVQPDDVLREIKPFLEKPDFEWQSAAVLQLLSDRPQPRFLNMYTHEPDSVQHWFWKWYQPELFLNVHAADLAQWGGEIPKRYKSFDAYLGKLLQRVDQAPEKTVLLVVSDHGHSPTILHQSYYSQHRHGPPGIFLACGGPIRAGEKLASGSIYDIFPTVLYLLGLPIPADAAGQVLDPIVDPAFLAAHPRRSIPTYDGLWASPHAPGAKSGLNKEELEKLKSLGYI